MSSEQMKQFMDARGHGFFRLAAIVPLVYLGDPKRNCDSHLEMLEKVCAEGANYAVGPELGLTGYSCKDLFQHLEVLQREAMESLEVLLQETRDMQLMFTVGMPLAVENKLFNCAVTCAGGRVIAVTPKSYPPNYREFEEERWFATANVAQGDTCEILGYEVPFGSDVLVTWPDYDKNFVLHLSICEDLWVNIPPSNLAALAEATVLANLSASNITIGKSTYREGLVLDSSARNIAVQIYTAAGAGESTDDLAWDGDAYIAERGNLLVRSKRFSMKSEYIIADVDLQSLITERIGQNSFRINRANFPQKFRKVVYRTDSPEPNEVYFQVRRKVDAFPFVPNDPNKRDEHCFESFMIQATGLVGRMRALPPNAKPHLGISGGLDSSIAAIVIAYAMDLQELPRKNIMMYTMPGLGTTDRTHDNAVSLAHAIGATFKEIPIVPIAEEMFRAIDYDPVADNYGLPSENVQAWARTHVLLAESCKNGGFVVGTGDLSEACLGWCTYLGDHASHYNVNTSVPKTLIKYLIDWAKDHIFEEAEIQQVLADILATPISPELKPAKDGKIVQVTENEIGPYELHDFTIYHTLRMKMAPRKIVRLAYEANRGFSKEYSIGEIKHWQEVFIKRYFASQFKRMMAPGGPKAGLASVSPRGDLRQPSDAKPDAWLRSVDSIPDIG